ncbi:MAG: MCE family protein [Xanthomonadaceae bacterium]|nr:MCE family protein [Xanthomonadaceae bacterium]MDE1884577.1 MCE family protein [Xanthomonadaceae bacterium]MDE1961713.1 MCE family protein [Xanthomonadaceae bacterium]MDE2085104.1 MCE family protein [Xanthomonadaceae bacterium]
MKRDNVNYALVGAAVLVAGSLLLVALAMITGRGGASTAYYTHYHNVTGLRYGAPVFYQGYRIGQVGAIAPERGKDGTRYRIELDVRRDWPIPQDSVARLTATGLLADVAVGISEGKSARMAAPGSELAGVESADIFSAMNELAGQISGLTRTQIAPLIQTLSKRVDSITGAIDKGTPDLVRQSQQLLTRLNRVSDSLDDMLKPDNRAAVAAILANTQQMTKQLRDTQQKLDDALGQLDSIARENRPGIRDSVADLRAVLEALSGRMDSISQHLENASRNFDELAREVRKNPNRLLISPKPDKAEDTQ